MVVADLLGVPEEDHEDFREAFGAQGEGTNIGGLDHEVIAVNPLAWADEKFSRYIEERRENPRDDVLTSIATAKYPDGSTPEVVDVVRTATFLFAAGQETTAKLLGAAMRVLGDRPDIQQQLRDDRSLIPVFVEECLRMDSPVKSVFRMARKTTTLGDTPVPAGTTVMVSPGAANRDPNRFENPHEFSLDRKNVREHIAFSRGIHSCPGAPLARVEGRVSIERLLDRLGEITVDEEKHGPIDARRYVYEPTFILRGLTEMNIKFTPVGLRADSIGGGGARGRSPRSQSGSRSVPGTQVRNRPSGACATSPSIRRAQVVLVLDSVHLGRAEPSRFVSPRRPAEHQPSPRRHPERVVGGVVAVGAQHDVGRDARRAVRDNCTRRPAAAVAAERPLAQRSPHRQSPTQQALRRWIAPRHFHMSGNEILAFGEHYSDHD